MRLFRTAQKKEGLRFGEDAAFICSEFEAQGRENTLELRLSRLRAMEIYKNGVRQKRQSDVQGLLKTVLFCPEDLMLVRAGAAARRRFLDGGYCGSDDCSRPCCLRRFWRRQYGRRSSPAMWR